jgi:hypothetical protein
VFVTLELSYPVFNSHHHSAPRLCLQSQFLKHNTPKPQIHACPSRPRFFIRLQACTVKLVISDRHQQNNSQLRRCEVLAETGPCTSPEGPEIGVCSCGVGIVGEEALWAEGGRIRVVGGGVLQGVGEGDYDEVVIDWICLAFVINRGSEELSADCIQVQSSACRGNHTQVLLSGRRILPGRVAAFLL